MLSVLFAYLIFPIAAWLEKIRLPRAAAVLIADLVLVAFVSGCIYLLSSQISGFVEETANIEEKVKGNIDKVRDFVEVDLGISINGGGSGDSDSFLKSILMQGGNFFKSAVTSVATTTGRILIMPLFIFLFLYYRDRLGNFLLMITHNESEKNVRHIVNQISKVTVKYVSGLFIVVAILSILNVLGLWIIGMDNAMLIGIIAGLFNVIPYFGTFIGGAVPVLYALLIGDDPSIVVYVIVLTFIIQFIENNLLTPNITGGQVQINPLVTIISILSGAALWGIPGMVLAVPVIGMLKIVFDNIESLKPFGYLMGKGKE
jgi:predicted PurR-regulated permease PerM